MAGAGAGAGAAFGFQLKKGEAAASPCLDTMEWESDAARVVLDD
jgi:hypothetical protein